MCINKPNNIINIYNAIQEGQLTLDGVDICNHYNLTSADVQQNDTAQAIIHPNQQRFELPTNTVSHTVGRLATQQY